MYTGAYPHGHMSTRAHPHPHTCTPTHMGARTARTRPRSPARNCNSRIMRPGTLAGKCLGARTHPHSPARHCNSRIMRPDTLAGKRTGMHACLQACMLADVQARKHRARTPRLRLFFPQTYTRIAEFGCFVSAILRLCVGSAGSSALARKKKKRASLGSASSKTRGLARFAEDPTRAYKKIKRASLGSATLKTRRLVSCLRICKHACPRVHAYARHRVTRVCTCVHTCARTYMHTHPPRHTHACQHTRMHMHARACRARMQC